MPWAAPPIYFQSTLLMAADEDRTAFANEDKIHLLIGLTSNIDIYESQSDGGMKLSFEANGRIPLGFTRPERLERLPNKVRVIDCTAVRWLPGGDDWDHQYYHRIDLVVNDAAQVFAGVKSCKIQPRRADAKCETRRFVMPAPAMKIADRQ